MRTVLAIFVVFHVGVAAAAPMGRLFFTPEERARIDQGQGHLQTNEVPDTAPVVNGVVRRADGRATVWIDGQARQETLRRLDDVAPNVSSPDAPDDSRIQIRVHRP